MTVGYQACGTDTLGKVQTWDVDFLERWIKQHAADAKAMGKPFMIEEFGKEVHLESGVKANISSIRGPFYRKVYQQLQESLNADGPLKGVLPCCMAAQLHTNYGFVFVS